MNFRVGLWNLDIWHIRWKWPMMIFCASYPASYTSSHGKSDSDTSSRGEPVSVASGMPVWNKILQDCSSLCPPGKTRCPTAALCVMCFGVPALLVVCIWCVSPMLPLILPVDTEFRSVNIIYGTKDTRGSVDCNEQIGCTVKPLIKDTIQRTTLMPPKCLR